MTQMFHGSRGSILTGDVFKSAFFNSIEQKYLVSLLTCVMTMNTAIPVDAGVESHWRGLLWDFFILTIVQPMHRLRSRYSIWICEAMSKTNGKWNQSQLSFRNTTNLLLFFLFPQLKNEPTLCAVKAQSPNHRTAREFPNFILFALRT